MKEELQRIYDSVPEDEPKSRLEPYRELILRWRRQGRTYHRIRELLATRCNVTVAYVTLYRFIKRCSRPRKAQPDLGFEPETQPVNDSSGAVQSVERKPRMTPEERAALRASYDRPLFPNEEQKPLFVRKPGPIRNLNNETQGEN